MQDVPPDRLKAGGTGTPITRTLHVMHTNVHGDLMLAPAHERGMCCACSAGTGRHEHNDGWLQLGQRLPDTATTIAVSLARGEAGSVGLTARWRGHGRAIGHAIRAIVRCAAAPYRAAASCAAARRCTIARASLRTAAMSRRAPTCAATRRHARRAATDLSRQHNRARPRHRTH